MGSEDTKKRIMDCTMELIRELDGDIDNVTIRTIAKRAGVGVGLTNHYFQSKDLLVAACVDSVFKDLFAAFVSSESENSGDFPKEDISGPMDSTKRAARNVLRFFMQNQAITRVAINLESRNPEIGNYTTKLVNSFAYCMVDRKKLEDMLSNGRMSERMKQQFREHIISEQRIKAFMITATLKDAFIRRALLKETIGVNINDMDQCYEYVDELIEILL